MYKTYNLEDNLINLQFPIYKEQDYGIYGAKLLYVPPDREMIVCNSWSDSVTYAVTYTTSFGLGFSVGVFGSCGSFVFYKYRKGLMVN